MTEKVPNPKRYTRLSVQDAAYRVVRMAGCFVPVIAGERLSLPVDALLKEIGIAIGAERAHGTRRLRKAKKWRELAKRRKWLVDAGNRLIDYWKTQAEEARRELRLCSGLGDLEMAFLRGEWQEACRWSAAWKASAKRNRARVRALDALMRASERLMAGELVMARTAKDQYKHRVKELERLMTEGVGLSPHLGGVEGHVINPLFVAEHVGE